MANYTSLLDANKTFKNYKELDKTLKNKEDWLEYIINDKYSIK